MRATRLLTGLLLLLSCTHLGDLRSPPYQECVPNKIAAPYNLKFCGAPYSEEDVTRYLKAFEDEWSVTSFLPKNPGLLKYALNNTEVRFQKFVFSNPNGGSPHLLGLTIPDNAPYKIFVLQPKTGGGVESTVLGHELIHLGLGVITADAEPDHITGGIEWPEEYLRFLMRVEFRYRSENKSY